MEPRAQRTISFKVAIEIDKLSTKLDMEQPILKNSFDSFYESVIGLVRFTKIEIEKDNNMKDVLSFKEITQTFRKSVDTLIGTLKSGLEGSKNLIGLSRNLNISQNKYKKVLSILIDNLSLGKLICDKIIEMLNEKFQL